MNRTLAIIIGTGFLMTACADECENFADVFCSKYSVCVSFLNAGDKADCIQDGIELTEQLKAADGSTDSEQQDNCVTAREKLEAMSCEEYVDT